MADTESFDEFSEVLNSNKHYINQLIHKPGSHL